MNTSTQCYSTYFFIGLGVGSVNTPLRSTLFHNVNSEGSSSLQGLLLIVKIFFSVKFDWNDALNLESLLLEDEIIMRDQFRQYCRDKLFPRVLESNRHEGMCMGLISSSVYTTVVSLMKSSRD